MLLLVACTPSDLRIAPDADEPARPDNVEQLDEVDEPEEPDDPTACSKIFDGDELGEFAVEIGNDAWTSINAEYSAFDGAKNYYPLELFVWDGEEVENASIRLKGNEGYSWGVPKMQFVVSFVEIDPDQRFHGTRHVAFDAPWYEPTLLRNRLSAKLLREWGIPAPCANNGTLTINGEFYALYATMEQLDHEYLERNFGDDAADGNLYKYGWELANNPGADTSTASAFWATYDPVALAEIGDVEQWVDEWAAEATLSDIDGYWYYGHNYYTYEHPERGLLFLPWDLDATFDYYGTPRMDPLGFAAAYVPHEANVLAVPEYRARFVAQIADHVADLDVDALQAELDVWIAQIDEAAARDTRAYYTYADHVAQVATLREFVQDRTRYLRGWVEEQGG